MTALICSSAISMHTVLYYNFLLTIFIENRISYQITKPHKTSKFPSGVTKPWASLVPEPLLDYAMAYAPTLWVHHYMADPQLAAGLKSSLYVLVQHFFGPQTHGPYVVATPT
jgi:hypothetical protein